MKLETHREECGSEFREGSGLLDESRGSAVSSLERWFERYQTRAVRLAAVCLGSLHEAEDCVQSAWLYLVARFGRSRDERVQDPWRLLSRAVRHIACDELRRRHRQGVPTSLDQEDLAVAHPGMPDTGVSELLSRLPAPLAEVVRLRVLEEYDPRELAARLGVAEGTIWSRLSRARKALEELSGTPAGVGGDGIGDSGESWKAEGGEFAWTRASAEEAQALEVRGLPGPGPRAHTTQGRVSRAECAREELDR